MLASEGTHGGSVRCVDLGCDQSQGYLHSRPLSMADIEPLLRNGATGTFKILAPPNHEATPIARRG